MKIRQFTHGDLDGVACALVAQSLFPYSGYEVTYCQYGEGPMSIDAQVLRFIDAVEAGEEDAAKLFITDICPTPTVCARLDALSSRLDIVVQDHHATTAWAAKYSWMEHEAENKRCGAKMMLDWGHATHQEIEPFVAAVDAYDRWQLDAPERLRGEQLNMLYMFLGFDAFRKEFTNCFAADQTGWLKKLLKTLTARLENAVRSVINGQIQDAIHVDSQKRRYAFLILMGPYASEVGHTVLSEFPEVEYVAMSIPGVNTISLRSRDGGVDVGAIAKANGGGGHAAAAGFPKPLRALIWNATAGAFE